MTYIQIYSSLHGLLVLGYVSLLGLYISNYFLNGLFFREVTWAEDFIYETLDGSGLILFFYGVFKFLGLF